MVDIKLPIRVKSSLNMREHWAAKHRRSAKERRDVGLVLNTQARPELPCIVEMTRIAPRKFDDDNLRGAFKAVRDQIAEWLGADDGSDLIEWRYAQERGEPKEYAIRIKIISKPVAA